MFDSSDVHGIVPADLAPIDHDMWQMWPSLRIPIDRRTPGAIPVKEADLFSSRENGGKSSK